MSNKSTKQRLIEAASRIFSDKGYHATTVAEICEAADANIAAVNYYFGEKSALYYECFLHLFNLSNQVYPKPDSADAEVWLREFVRARVANIFDEGEAGLLPKLIHKEMGQPTELHQRIREELFEPLLRNVRAKIQEYLGEDATTEEVDLAQVNFSSVHIFMNVGRQQCKESPSCPFEHPWDTMEPEALLSQIEHFSMGGLQATREYLKNRKTHA